MTTIRPTKAQFRELNGWALGAGVLMLHSANNEVVTIEVFTGQDFVLRRVANGDPVLPITCSHDDEGYGNGNNDIAQILASGKAASTKPFEI